MDTTKEFLIEYRVPDEYLSAFVISLGFPVIVRARCAGWIKEGKPVVVTSSIEMAGNSFAYITDTVKVHDNILVAAMHAYKDQIYGVAFDLSPVAIRNTPKAHA